jgi:hypothetical protein
MEVHAALIRQHWRSSFLAIFRLAYTFIIIGQWPSTFIGDNWVADDYYFLFMDGLGQFLIMYILF